MFDAKKWCLSAKKWRLNAKKHLAFYEIDNLYFKLEALKR